MIEGACVGPLAVGSPAPARAIAVELNGVTMLRIEPEKNMRRFWSISLVTDLFGAIHLHRAWGRIGSRGSGKLYPFPSVGEARQAMAKLIASKRKRGYAPSTGLEASN